MFKKAMMTLQHVNLRREGDEDTAETAVDLKLRGTVLASEQRCGNCRWWHPNGEVTKRRDGSIQRFGECCAPRMMGLKRQWSSLETLRAKAFMPKRITYWMMLCAQHYSRRVSDGHSRGR